MADSALVRPLVRPVPLAALVPGAPPVAITGISLDSRRVAPGDLYLGLPGATSHGARFADAAAALGAVAVLTDPAGAALAGDPGIPVVVLSDPRAAMADLAVRVYGAPAAALTMFGLTGTNGKTSTMFLLAAGLAAVGEKVGTIGTIGFGLAGEPLPSSRTTVTTPEAPDLQALLALMRERGATCVAMEVSSHALALDRVAGIRFDVSGFTHLGRDHLDFHRDQEQYFQAKARLFTDGRSRTCVISVDDAAGQRLARLVADEGTARLVTCSVEGAADYRVPRWTTDESGRSHIELRTPTDTHEFTVGMLGAFNVRNALLAAAMIEAAGLPLARALGGFATAAVPGRMQRVELGDHAPRVVVDFAHTPEAVAAALDALPAGRRVAVLGCGGDRDAAKRGPMGAAAARLAEVVVVTDDNPRSERPADIRAAVLSGAEREATSSGALVLDGGDRRSAIRTALELAGEGAWIAVLGKGHERGQDIGGVITPFDDVQVVGEEWAGLARAGGN